MPSTTASKPRGPGRPKGGRAGQAERRLKRELADKEGLLELLRAGAGIISTYEHTALNNPVSGIVLGVSAFAVLHRFRLISTLDYALGLSAIGALEVASVADKLGEGISGIITSVGSLLHPIGNVTTTNYDNLVAPSQNNAIVTGNQQIATKRIGVGETVNVKPV